MLARLFMLRYHDPRSIRRCHEVLIVVVMVLSSPGIGLGICLLYALPSMDKLLPLECLPLVERVIHSLVRMLFQLLRDFIVFINPNELIPPFLNWRLQ